MPERRAIVTTATGVFVRIRLTPRSARDAIEGEETLADGSSVVLARVRAVPENGAANAALESLVAKTVGVAKSRVTVVSGATSPIKTVDIEGEPDAIVERLNEVLIP
jgi:uncharacterized protein YggU (UPF0235/DUF167 family)